MMTAEMLFISTAYNKTHGGLGRVKRVVTVYSEEQLPTQAGKLKHMSLSGCSLRYLTANSQSFLGCPQ